MAPRRSTKPATTPDLRGLRSSQFLERLPAESFDDLLTAATHICRASLAAITFVEGHRQWLRANVTLEELQGACAAAVSVFRGAPPEMLVVRDLAKHGGDRSRRGPVAGISIRFFAGIQLATPAGHVIGSLCVMDSAPRRLDAAQRLALAAVARQAVAQMELRRAVVGLSELARVQELEGLEEKLAKLAVFRRWLPVCRCCHKLQHDKDYWQQLEQFAHEHLPEGLEYGICPQCVSQTA